MKLLKYLVLLCLIVAAIGTLLVYVFPEKAVGLALQAERGRSGLTIQTKQIGPWQWAYLDSDPQLRDSNKEVIVLLHGFGANKDNWTRFSRHLTKSYRVIAPDLPGFGDNSRIAGEQYDMPAQAPRLQEFVKSLGLKRFHIAGNSMGGNLAGFYSSLHPEQILSIGFINNSGVAAPNASVMDEQVKMGKNPLLVTDVDDYDRMLEFVTVEPPAIPGFVKKVFAQNAVANAEFNSYIYQQYKSNRRAWLEQYLPRLTQPVLVLWGDTDRVIDVSTVETMKPLLQNKTIVIMPQTGHAPMVERPKATADHYLQFLAGVGT